MGSKGKKNRGQKKQAAAAAGGAAAPAAASGHLKRGTMVEVKMKPEDKWKVGYVDRRTASGGYWVLLEGAEHAYHWPIIRLPPEPSPDSPPPASGPATQPSGSRSASGGTEGEDFIPPQPEQVQEKAPQAVAQHAEREDAERGDAERGDAERGDAERGEPGGQPAAATEPPADGAPCGDASPTRGDGPPETVQELGHEEHCPGSSPEREPLAEGPPGAVITPPASPVPAPAAAVAPLASDATASPRDASSTPARRELPSEVEDAGRLAAAAGQAAWHAAVGATMSRAEAERRQRINDERFEDARLIYSIKEQAEGEVRARQRAQQAGAGGAGQPAAGAAGQPAPGAAGQPQFDRGAMGGGRVPR